MNKDNAKDFLPLVQALADGKVIQFNYPEDSSEWTDIPDPSFTYPVECWRIKPEPREWWICVNKGTNPASSISDPVICLVSQLGISESREQIKVREILD